MSTEKEGAQTVTEAPQIVTATPITETKTSETTTLDPDAEKRVGIKEAVVNSDAIAVEKEKVEVKAEEKPVRPSFFVKKSDKHRVEVDILTSRSDGRIMSISRTGMGLDFEKDFSFMNHEVSWFDFSLPNYEDMSTYRQRSSAYRREAQGVIVDKLQLRNFLLVWHLKDWSLTDESGNKVELNHEDTGALTDESVAKVYAVNPTLIDVVLTIFEKDILMV
jgi:hypothetical protein